MSDVISIEPVLPFSLISSSHQNTHWIIGQCMTSSVYFSGWAYAALSENKSRSVSSAMIPMIVDSLYSADSVQTVCL